MNDVIGAHHRLAYGGTLEYGSTGERLIVTPRADEYVTTLGGCRGTKAADHPGGDCASAG